MADNMYLGKTHTNSNLAWHMPQSAAFLQEEELMQKSDRALVTVTEPLERLRLKCLSRGAIGIMGMARIFRRIGNDDGSRRLNREEFFKAMKETGLDTSDKHIDELFDIFDTENSGSISVDEFIKQIRPPMSDARREIVEQVFRKLDKSGEGALSVEDMRSAYCVNSHPKYMNGDETAELVLDRFLANFETAEGKVYGKVTQEEFMNYYSGISVSIDNDCFFNLMMRQSYKL